MNVAGIGLRDPHDVGGGDICRAVRATTAQGRAVFVKTLTDPPTGFFAAEERGLDFLRVTDGPPLPQTVAAADDGLVVDWVEPGPPGRQASEAFGRALAAMHTSEVASFGADMDGFIATLPLENAPGENWPTFYAEHRLRPFLAALDPVDRRPVEAVCDRIGELAGTVEPPARIHGDLWSGNLLWGADGRVWLVDAASAHGGHRETDLAMLQLFGSPYLDRILASYAEAAPPSPGWRERTPLHQIHPLLVHATLFGGGYGARAAAAARAALRA